MPKKYAEKLKQKKVEKNRIHEKKIIFFQKRVSIKTKTDFMISTNNSSIRYQR